MVLCAGINGIYAQAAGKATPQETAMLEEELRLAKKELGDAAAKHLVEMGTMKQEAKVRVSFICLML